MQYAVSEVFIGIMRQQEISTFSQWHYGSFAKFTHWEITKFTEITMKAVTARGVHIHAHLHKHVYVCILVEWQCSSLHSHNVRQSYQLACQCSLYSYVLCLFCSLFTIIWHIFNLSYAGCSALLLSHAAFVRKQLSLPWL